MYLMFKEYIKSGDDPFAIFGMHPAVHAHLLEGIWGLYYNHVNEIKPDVPKVSQEKKEQTFLVAPNPLLTGSNNVITSTLNNVIDGIRSQTEEMKVRPWMHLIYAYMIENTRLVPIFRRVIERYVRGEELSIVKEPFSRRWLYATEQLFFKELPFYYSFALTSNVRTDLEASRRNAYYRMFGMDLNHGTDTNQPYPYFKAKLANKKFVSVFEKFLLEVWRGIQNAANTSGANPTDEGTILNLVDELKDMMNDRRRYENLEQEEFFYVSMLSWFHLTLLENTPIVIDLDAQANSPDDRLRKIGDRVGLPAHGKAKNMFELAEPLALILTMIEKGEFDATSVKNLYIDNNAVPNSIRDNMLKIITHWSIATGSDIKTGKLKSAA